MNRINYTTRVANFHILKITIDVVFEVNEVIEMF